MSDIKLKPCPFCGRELEEKSRRKHDCIKIAATLNKWEVIVDD